MKIETKTVPVLAHFTEGPCGYYADRISRNHSITDERHEFSQAQITRILNKGYRRFGFDYYRPYCRTCRECTPYRILVATFEPNRTQRRTLKRNTRVDVHWGEARPTQEKFELYVRYQMDRHKDFGETSDLLVRKNLATAMIGQMYLNPQSSLELTVSENGHVLSFAVFDVTNDSLSAVYSVFEPTFSSRSLGTLNILLGIEKTRALGLPYLNLGLYLAGHEKMAYKANFGPAEVYRKFNWGPAEVQS